MGVWERLWLRGAGGELLCPSSLCARVNRASGAELGVCPTCRKALPAADGAVFPRRAVALIGSDRCGQTSWLIRSFDEITKETERYRFAIDGQEKQWEEQLRSLSLGKPAPSTPGLPGAAWCLDFARGGVCRRLYVYDIAAQEAADVRRLTRHRSFGRLNGLVLVVDPFGLAAVRQRYGHAIRDLRPPVNPTPQSFGEAELAVVIQALATTRPAPLSGTWDLSVAVVFTKLDVLGLGRRLGSETGSSSEDIQRACRAQAAEWGFENMIRVLDAHFQRVRFFGAWPGSRGGFAPGNALLWMYGEAP